MTQQVIGSVLVVGGGIAGMQAALDLANSGYYVHLAEKSPAIGGTMAQIDKTFPTNDCAMWIISPKLVEVGRHPNIRLHTLAEVQDISGSPGNLTVSLSRQARYIDADKCTGCGVCLDACPIRYEVQFPDTVKRARSAYSQAIDEDAVADIIDRHRVESAAGSIGDFNTTLSNGETVSHGILVLATGAKAYQPVGQYLYQEHPNVLLSLDLDRELMADNGRLRGLEAAAFIQCVGSRIPERPYCSRVCCSHSLENAIKLKELNPDMDVYVLYRDLRTYGEWEKLYKKARELGVIFFRYNVTEPPEVVEVDGKIQITVQDHILRQPVQFAVDLLTLATAIVPYPNKPLAEIYKVAMSEEGFFNEAHAKIRPVDSATEGIFLAGLSHNPKPIEDSIRLGLAAVARAATVLSKDYLELESIVSHPVDENCDGCAFCVDACPYQAITLIEYMKDGGVKKTVEVNEAQCKGCGSCMATCPKQGIYVAGFTLGQLGAQVEAALGIM